MDLYLQKVSAPVLAEGTAAGRIGGTGRTRTGWRHLLAFRPNPAAPYCLARIALGHPSV